MGRREIWSDPQIQQIASEYVCVIEETFFLYPPEWLKDPPNPAATRLFRKYVANSPKGMIPVGTSTYQGLYAMMPDGSYLAGKFARQSRDEALNVLKGGLAKWRSTVGRTGVKSQQVPDNKLAMYGGEELRKGGLKLEVAYRDLPRGEVRRPGNAQFPNPYNLGWFDLSPAEATTLIPKGGEKISVPPKVFRKLALTTLKDAVRGQMQNWKEGDLKEGQLSVRRVSQDGETIRYELSGNALLRRGDLSYAPSFHGWFAYDPAKGEFKEFWMMAAGQRTGKGAANGRATDLGPAPMGIALTLYQP